MNLPAIVLKKLEGRFGRIRSAWLRWRFISWEQPFHKTIRLGSDNVFQAPLRGGGCGTLIIGNGNCFGYTPASKLGTGEILFQARLPSAVVEIGDENILSNNVSIVANERVTIGSRCQIGDLVAVYDSDFHEIDPATRNRSHGQTGPVLIGNNVWLGSRVMVLKGVNIGDNSVIAAMSLVTRSVPPNTVAGGVPAKPIRSIE